MKRRVKPDCGEEREGNSLAGEREKKTGCGGKVTNWQAGKRERRCCRERTGGMELRKRPAIG